LVFLDEYNISTGAKVQTVDITNSTSDSLYLSSSAAEGLISLSPNGQYLSLLGYKAKSGSLIYNNSATVSPRTVSLVKYDGTINNTTALTDFAVNSTGATTGTAITTNGTDLWMAASQTNGIAYTTTGSTSGEVYVATNNTSNRSVSIFQNDLYFVAASGISLVL